MEKTKKEKKIVNDNDKDSFFFQVFVLVSKIYHVFIISFIMIISDIH